MRTTAIKPPLTSIRRRAAATRSPQPQFATALLSILFFVFTHAQTSEIHTSIVLNSTQQATSKGGSQEERSSQELNHIPDS